MGDDEESAVYYDVGDEDDEGEIIVGCGILERGSVGRLGDSWNLSRLLAFFQVRY